MLSPADRVHRTRELIDKGNTYYAFVFGIQKGLLLRQEDLT